ncbi:MAG: PRC-barrel domain-containing protein [archaeon]
MARILIRDLQGKTVVSEGGKMFGKVSDVTADLSTGELINIIVEPTKYLTQQMENIISDERGRILLPFSAVGAIGDFVLINEKDIV